MFFPFFGKVKSVLDNTLCAFFGDKADLISDFFAVGLNVKAEFCRVESSLNFKEVFTFSFLCPAADSNVEVFGVFSYHDKVDVF
ncbi:hypothetical protein SDC9_151167 [bioreactor metagenome]|uniref:Uncharacterized protein n=1 Tax=bioreactor metagenome TaxID=1076179 RepID=A0A645ERN6_9ZZZZ